jgi:hypothetical protein
MRGRRGKRRGGKRLSCECWHGVGADDATCIAEIAAAVACVDKKARGRRNSSSVHRVQRMLTTSMPLVVGSAHEQLR